MAHHRHRRLLVSVLVLAVVAAVRGVAGVGVIGEGPIETAQVPSRIGVERKAMATSIGALLSEIIFDAPGEEFPIVALADFPAEEAVDVTGSSKVTYSSSNRAVAVVTADGMVTAIGPGHASITVTYAGAGKRVSANIPVTVPPAVFTMTPGSFDFGGQNVGTARSKRVTLTNSSGYTLNIVGIETTGDFTQTNDCVSSSPMAPDVTCRITLTFRPTAVGPGEGVLTILNDNRTAGFKLAGTGRAIK